ncbi:hypothetical protein R6242_03565 [Iodobacter sp. CM08]|uniref:hypothetical protein n=1 Tax=Iodobacter sp. CM08 TaxID=3085902 RepID=UPI002981698A|nr:hypothetical protein [Iodobacter sp. CM08]MDW5415647.1 hypothetical protein [Iodobacter sp. CM08]
METLEVQMPLVSRQRFADLVGVTLDTVNKWCDRGYAPTVQMGRWSLINLALINSRCLDKEFKSLDTNIVSLRAHRADATARSA